MGDANKYPRSLTTPLVSIVTPSYNQGAYVQKTILSVLRQDYEHIEYIVVDGMSEDETTDILRKYSKRVTTVIRETDNGQADAIDKGFRASSGEIMAYLNSDDCYASAKIVSRAVELFNRNLDVDVIYGRRQFINEKGFFTLHQPFRPFDEEILKKACYIPQECVFWRRSIYEKAGNFVDKSYDFAMDYDLWLRFLEAGAKFLAVDEPFGLFRSYAEQKSQAQWYHKGLPEIARLQEKYLGAGLSEDEIRIAHDTYLFQMSRKTDEQSWDQLQHRWLDFVKARKNWLSCCPLDIWVFQGSYA